jgi:hypothetical protein
MKEKKMLSPSQYAEKIGKPYQTVMAWLRKDLIEGAQKTEVGRMFVYLIPEDANYSEPMMGRPSKKAATEAEAIEATRESAPVKGKAGTQKWGKKKL